MPLTLEPSSSADLFLWRYQKSAQESLRIRWRMLFLGLNNLMCLKDTLGHYSFYGKLTKDHLSYEFRYRSSTDYATLSPSSDYACWILSDGHPLIRCFSDYEYSAYYVIIVDTIFSITYGRSQTSLEISHSCKTSRLNSLCSNLQEYSVSLWCDTMWLFYHFLFSSLIFHEFRVHYNNILWFLFFCFALKQFILTY